jgi:hypothetical protein
MHPAYLETRLAHVQHWCPLDSGGVRLGFQQGPNGVAPDELLLSPDSLAELLWLADDERVERAVRAGRPLWTSRAEPLDAAPVLEAFRGRPTTQREWTYEVFLGEAAPPTGAEVARIYCPNTAAGRVRELMEGVADDRIRTYNPRWTLDTLAAQLDYDDADGGDGADTDGGHDALQPAARAAGSVA